MLSTFSCLILIVKHNLRQAFGIYIIFRYRIPQKYLMKRFQTWVTFMSSGLDSEPVWMVTRRQKLIEVRIVLCSS